MRVLAFEDKTDIEAMLIDGGVDVSQLVFEQRWSSEDAIEVIREFSPEVLLLDHFMPPMRGLAVLKAVNEAVADGGLARPTTIVGMSSANFANFAMLDEGADQAILKFDLASLDLWPRRG